MTETQLTTPLGDVWVTPLTLTEVHVDANSNGKGLTLRGGARFGVSFNLIRQADGTWALSAVDGRPYVYTSRAWGQPGKAFDHATPFQREDMLKKVAPVVTAWADANLPARIEAEVASRERTVERAEREYQEKRAAAEAASVALAKATQALDAARLLAVSLPSTLQEDTREAS